MDAFLNLAGRLLLAQLFLLSGWSKITGYSAAAGYMASRGLPGELLPLVIAAEVGGGIALVVGLQVRWIALALAAFSVAAAVIFHWAPGDQNQTIHFMKNMAIAGGLLLLAQSGATRWAIDRPRAGSGEQAT